MVKEIRRVFGPVYVPSIQQITVDSDPQSYQGAFDNGGGYTTTSTFTFTPAKLRNDRYQIQELYVSVAAQKSINATTAIIKIQLNGADFGASHYMEKLDASRFPTHAWSVPVTNYNQNYVIAIMVGACNNSNNYDVYNATVTAKVISYA